MTDLDLSRVRAFRDGVARWPTDRDGYVRVRRSDLLFLFDVAIRQAEALDDLARKAARAAPPRFYERRRQTLR